MPAGPSYVLFTPVLRSSHLERLAPIEGVRFSVAALGRHPDCDPALLRDPPFPVTVAPLEDHAAALAADPPALLEVTEPLWTPEWAGALRLASAAPHALLVSYAIENLLRPAPHPDPHPLDAIAFGSAAARSTYADAYPGWQVPTVVVEERRAPCPRCRLDRAEREVVFCAEFSARKGIDVLMAAWEQVAAEGWRLRLLGYGPETERVRAWAGRRDDVDVVVAASRQAVHDAMRRAAVLVLPSRRVPGWREQIGLSLLEGLAHGCRLVTTTETGLADGLAVEGQVVVAPDDVSALRDGLRRACAEEPGVKTARATRESRQQVQAGFAALVAEEH